MRNTTFKLLEKVKNVQLLQKIKISSHGPLLNVRRREMSRRKLCRKIFPSRFTFRSILGRIPSISSMVLLLSALSMIRTKTKVGNFKNTNQRTVDLIQGGKGRHSHEWTGHERTKETNAKSRIRTPGQTEVHLNRPRNTTQWFECRLSSRNATLRKEQGLPVQQRRVKWRNAYTSTI